jgi:hypothetical protein
MHELLLRKQATSLCQVRQNSGKKRKQISIPQKMPVLCTLGNTRFVEDGVMRVRIPLIYQLVSNVARRFGLNAHDPKVPGRSAGLDHFFRTDQAIEFFLCHMTKADRLFAQGRSIFMRSLGDCCGLVVADFWRERRYQHQ